MSLATVDTLMKEAEHLSVEEQLLLMSRLIETIQQHVATTRPKWQDIRGMAQSPLVGEDAQSWVSQTRQDGDSRREQQWRQVP